MRKGVKFEQRCYTGSDCAGVEKEWQEQLAFCLRHREQSELVVQPNTKSGIKKKKTKPSHSAKVPFSCPICRTECAWPVRRKHPLLGLRRDYALSKQANRLREESKEGGELESEDEQPTAEKRKKPSPPPPPADSIAAQRGRRGSSKQHQQADADQGDKQSQSDSAHDTSADEMPLDDVDDSALFTSAGPASSISSPHPSNQHNKPRFAAALGTEPRVEIARHRLQTQRQSSPKPIAAPSHNRRGSTTVSVATSPLGHAHGRLDGKTSPVPPLVLGATELPKVVDLTSPRRVHQCYNLLADESICDALHALRDRSKWESSVAIARHFQPHHIQALLTLHGYSCRAEGQGKLMLTTLIRLVHSGKIQSPDDIRAHCRTLTLGWQKTQPAGGDRKEVVLVGDSDDSECATIEPIGRREKRQAEHSLQRRRQKKTKRQHRNQRSGNDGEDDGDDNNSLDGAQARQTAVTLTRATENRQEGEAMQVEELRTDAGVSPPMLPRIDNTVRSVHVVADDPPATTRHGSLLSPSSGTSSKSSIPSSQSTFPSSQSSGAVTVQRVISFSSADQSAAGSITAPSASSSSARQNRLQRYAEQRDGQTSKLAEDEVELMRQVLDGLSEEFRQPFAQPVDNIA